MKHHNHARLTHAPLELETGVEVVELLDPSYAAAQWEYWLSRQHEEPHPHPEWADTKPL